MNFMLNHTLKTSILYLYTLLCIIMYTVQSHVKAIQLIWFENYLSEATLIHCKFSVKSASGTTK